MTRGRCQVCQKQLMHPATRFCGAYCRDNPQCPHCEGKSWTQLENGPLTCTRCATQWAHHGQHDHPLTPGGMTLAFHFTAQELTPCDFQPSGQCQA